MGIEKKIKLNHLMRSWPDGKIKSSTWLSAKGYGANYIQKYKGNNWIEAIGAGAFKKSGDEVTWAVAVECLQNELKYEVHVGGKSAIEFSGKAQYLKMKETSVILLSNKNKTLPAWMRKYDWNVKLNFKVKNLFKPNLTFGEKENGFIVVDTDKAKIIVSSPERAYFEYLDELPKHASYTEAKEIMENMITLRASIVQHLLESCISLKVKRLFLHFAEKINHPWFKKLNLKKINLGSGKRVIFKNGRLDKKYNITVPKDDSYEEV